MKSSNLTGPQGKTKVAYNRRGDVSSASAPFAHREASLLSKTIVKSSDDIAVPSEGFPVAVASPGSSVHGPNAFGVAGVHIVTENISEAWVGALSVLMQPGVDAIEPLVVTVTGFDDDGNPYETLPIRSLIDSELRTAHAAHVRQSGRKPKHGPLTVAAAANTIFPESLWNPEKSRDELYGKYRAILPRLRRDPRNKRGTYFERLIAYGRGPEDGNQLEHMFCAFAKRVKRTSAYQATIVDPKTDLTKTPLLGFPCLQQIAVHPCRRTGTLGITGFYGTQYLFERGYGNFIGICRLGRFLACGMGLRLTRMTCVAGYAPMEAIGKSRGRALVTAARQAVADNAADVQAATTPR